VVYTLPSQRAHLAGPGIDMTVRRRLRLLGELLSRPLCLVAFGLQLTGIVPLVAITTIMSVFLVSNLGYPRGGLQMLYVVGGLANFFISRVLGKGIDRFGPGIVSVLSSILLMAAICVGYLGFGWSIVAGLEHAIQNGLDATSLGSVWAFVRRHGVYPELLPVVLVFTVFFFTSSARLVVAQSVTLRIPKPDERAGFQSLSQSVQSFAMAMSALSIPLVLGSTPDGKFTGIGPFAGGVLVVTWLFPFLVYWLNTLLNQRDRPAPLPTIEAVPAE
jgi:predicted MFS family arabinose efflux permease